MIVFKFQNKDVIVTKSKVVLILEYSNLIGKHKVREKKVTVKTFTADAICKI